MFVDNVAHNLCCEIRADNNSSTYTFTTARSITCTFRTGKSVVLMEHRNNNIVFACFNCTSHIINFGYVDYFREYRCLKR